jgi:hypothetical protein
MYFMSINKLKPGVDHAQFNKVIAAHWEWVKHQLVAAAIVIFLLVSGCASAQYSYPDPDISIQNMEATVRYLTTMTPARSYEHPESMERSAAYISQKLSEYGLKPTEQEFIVNGKRYVNIVASAGPQEGGRVIVGAHYDVCGDQPGADDNASAIAALLEIARFAKKHEIELKYRVDIAAYALEEPPFFGTVNMGSYVHAEYLHRNNIEVKGMISLEMIGFFTEEKDSQAYPLSILRPFYPSTGNFIAVVGNWGSSGLVNQVAKHMRKASIGIETLKAPSFVTGVDFSDHRNYRKFGYDAVMVTDTAFYRNKNYHETSDTMDTLSFPKMQEVAKGVCWAVFNMN